MNQPILTIFAAFTRPWAVDNWLDNLANVKHDPARTNLCVIVDCDEQPIADKIQAFAEKHNYRSFHVKVNKDWSPNEVRLAIRRMRVADIHNQSKDLIAKTDGDIIIGLEDDTVFDRLESFERLYQPILDDINIGFVEGVQMGRWGVKMIGAWQADNWLNTTKIQTCLPGKGYEDIDGGGFYGYATRRDLYLNHEYYTSSALPYGPDVCYSLWVRQRGYRCIIDWTTVFGHSDHGKIGYPDDPSIKLTQVVFTKNKLTGKWERADHERTF